MGCFSCGQKKTVLSYFSTPVNVVENSDCDITLEEILVVEERARCIKSVVKNNSLNNVIGMLLSMKNIKDYCRYSLIDINNILDTYETEC